MKQTMKQTMKQALKQQSKPNRVIRALERELSHAQDNLGRAELEHSNRPSPVSKQAVHTYRLEVNNIKAKLRDYARMQKSRVFYLAIGSDHHTDDELVLCRSFEQAAVWCEGFKLGCTQAHNLRPEEWKEDDVKPGYDDDWQLRIQHDLGYSVAVRRLVVVDPAT